MGRQLRVWDVSGIARNTGVRGRPDWGQRDDGGTVDCVCAESGWRVGRDVRELCDREIRSWSKHAIANSLGHLGAARLGRPGVGGIDRKSTRLNSSHLGISYAVFCLKKK